MKRSDVRSWLKSEIAAVRPLHDLAMKLRPRDAIFRRAYRTGAWGSLESGSGQGSELGATEAIRAYLPDLLRRLGVRAILDAPCGDLNWMSHVQLGDVRYVGVDVVPEVIERVRARHSRPGVEFSVVDLTRDEAPPADLVLSRDCWIHLSFRDIGAVLENFRHSGATWLLTTHSPEPTANRDQITGLPWRSLNLTLPPFNFPAPIEARKDNYSWIPHQIALWRIADLPRMRI